MSRRRWRWLALGAAALMLALVLALLLVDIDSPRLGDAALARLGRSTGLALTATGFGFNLRRGLCAA